MCWSAFHCFGARRSVPNNNRRNETAIASTARAWSISRLTKPRTYYWLPIRLDLEISSGVLRPNGTAAIDFIITNIGTESIRLPSSVVLFNAPMESLTLWVTSDAIKGIYAREVGSGRLVQLFDIVGISAELDGSSDDSKSFYSLAPNKSIRVHACSPEPMVGTHAFTAHAEFAHVTNTTEVIGTADSDSVTTTLSIPSPT
jgi:hypothetical protein